MAAASIFVMGIEKTIYDQNTNSMQSHINVGFGSDITIAELAKAVANVVGYQGKIIFDINKPDGNPRKWISSRLLNSLGWKAQVDLGLGLRLTYQDFLSKYYKNHL